MKFLHTIGLLKEVEVTTPPPTTTPTASPPTASPPTASPPPTPTFMPKPLAFKAPVDPETDEKLKELDKMANERLLQVLANDGAPLVEEFTDLVLTLSESIPDQRMCYKAALKVFHKKGLSKETILADYEKCLKALSLDLDSFSKETEAAIKAKVGSRQIAVTALEEQLKQIESQIQALQVTITTLTNNRNTELANIKTEEVKISLVQERYRSLQAEVVREIEAYKQRVFETQL